MIHGSDGSIGCIAVGDDAIAEIFNLAGTTKYRNWKLLLAPTDLRINAAPAEVISKLPWMAKIYEQLAAELAQYSGGNRI